MSAQSTSAELSQWYSHLRSSGQGKPIEHPMQNSTKARDAKLKIPIVASSLQSKMQKTVEKSAKRVDTLNSLFKIF